MSGSRPWSSLAFRLGLSYGAIMVLTMSIVLAVFYVQTVGVVRVRLDKQAENHLRRLMEHSAKYGPGALESEILQTIRDGPRWRAHWEQCRSLSPAKTQHHGGA